MDIAIRLVAYLAVLTNALLAVWAASAPTVLARGGWIAPIYPGRPYTALEAAVLLMNVTLAGGFVGLCSGLSSQDVQAPVATGFAAWLSLVCLIVWTTLITASDGLAEPIITIQMAMIALNWLMAAFVVRFVALGIFYRSLDRVQPLDMERFDTVFNMPFDTLGDCMGLRVLAHTALVHGCVINPIVVICNAGRHRYHGVQSAIFVIHALGGLLFLRASRTLWNGKSAWNGAVAEAIASLCFWLSLYCTLLDLQQAAYDMVACIQVASTAVIWLTLSFTLRLTTRGWGILVDSLLCPYLRALRNRLVAPETARMSVLDLRHE